MERGRDAPVTDRLPLAPRGCAARIRALLPAASLPAALRLLLLACRGLEPAAVVRLRCASLTAPSAATIGRGLLLLAVVCGGLPAAALPALRGLLALTAARLLPTCARLPALLPRVRLPAPCTALGVVRLLLLTAEAAVILGLRRSATLRGFSGFVTVNVEDFFDFGILGVVFLRADFDNEGDIVKLGAVLDHKDAGNMRNCRKLAIGDFDSLRVRMIQV